MGAPNIEVSTNREQLGHGSLDGVWIDNPAVIRSNPMQGMIQGGNKASIIGYNCNAAAQIGSCAANTSVANSITATGVLITPAIDFVLAVSPTDTVAANMVGICGIYANAANTITIQTTNPTTGAIVATANQQLYISTLRGWPVISCIPNSTPANLTTTNTMYEQTFTLNSSTATVTPTVNAAGQITAYTVTGAANAVTTGTFDTDSPTLVITPNPGYGGSGATAVVHLNTAGLPVSVQPTAFGSGYTQGQVTCTLIGGINVAPGMIAQVNPPSNVANFCIGNVRVTGPNQIGVTFFTANAAGANVVPPATAYKFVAFNELTAMNNTMQVQWVAPVNSIVSSANNSVQLGIAVPGVLTTDVLTPIYGPLAAVPNANVNYGPSTANSANNITVSIVSGITAANLVAAGTYGVSLTRISAFSPAVLYSCLFTPSAVAANTVIEQVFTMPTGATLQYTTGSNASSCLVNGTVYTGGVTTSTCGRVASATTVGITFINNTTGSITPPAQQFLICDFPALLPGPYNANYTMGICQQQVNPAINDVIDTLNEMQTSLVGIGAIKGA